MTEFARSGPLNWAQHMYWLYNDPWFYEHWGLTATIRRRVDVPPRTTRGMIEEAMLECSQRFQSLRTIYSRPGMQLPEQHVLRHFEPPVVEQGVSEQEHTTIYDRPSFRCHIESAEGFISAASITANQIDLDGFSIVHLVRMIELRLNGGEPIDEAGAYSQYHPIDCALEEQTAVLRRTSDRGVRWFKQIRDRAPRNLLPLVPGWEHSQRRFHSSRVRGAGLLSAVNVTSRIARVSTASTFHGLIVLVLSVWLDRRNVFLSSAVSNRWRQGLGSMIGRLAGEVDCEVQIDPSVSVQRFLKDIHALLIRSYRFGSRNMDDCIMEGVRDNCSYGSDLEKSVFVEYLDFFQDQEDDWESTPDRIISSRPESQSSHPIRFDIAPTGAGIEVSLLTNSEIMPLATSEAMLELLCDMAERISSDSEISVAEVLAYGCGRLTQAEEGEALVSPGRFRFSTDRILRQVLVCEGVEDAAVFSDSHDPALVRAYVLGHDLRVSDIHEVMLSACSNDPRLYAPRQYSLVGAVPPDRKSEAAWRQEAVGTWRARDFSDKSDSVADPRTDFLLEVFSRCNQGARAVASKSYADSFGSLLMIPAMTTELEDRGYTGVAPIDFLGMNTLLSLAKRLRPHQR